jgi:hypothetical protein
LEKKSRIFLEMLRVNRYFIFHYAILQSHSWEANRFGDGEEGSRILRTPFSLLCTQDPGTRLCHETDDILSPKENNET